MPGTKGKSGGARSTSGPIPQKFTVKQGETLLVWFTNGEAPLLGEVVKVDRKLIELKLNNDNILIISK